MDIETLLIDKIYDLIKLEIENSPSLKDSKLCFYDLKEKFNKDLEFKQQKVLEMLTVLAEEMAYQAQYDSFVKGFKTGLRLAMEALLS